VSNLIGNNAYRILGLDGSANQKDILKRYKEIINRLKIDDYPKYDLDVHLPDKFRTEESVNDALKKLQNVKNNLTEYFFWFDIVDTVDENALNHLQYTDATSHDKAITIWKNASETDNSTGLFYKKNLTVLYCLRLLNEENDDYLKESLTNWREIVNSDKFWATFEKRYVMNNDQTINADLIREFRGNVVKHISDIYHDLYQEYKNSKYVKDFQDVFGTLGEKTEKNLLKPIHQSIYDIIAELNKISLEKDDDSHEEDIKKTDYECENCGKISSKLSSKSFDYKDGSILCEECHKKIGKQWQKQIDSEETVEGSSKKLRQINKVIAKLKSRLDQLREIGLYEDSKSIAVRDDAAQAIRNAAIMIHNEALMKKKSLELLELATEISGTESTKEKWESDLKIVRENITEDEKSVLSFDMGGFLRKKDLIVKNDFMEYGKKKIYYKDVDSFSYYFKDPNFVFSIFSAKDEITIKFTDRNYWVEIVDRVVPLLIPIVINKTIKLIFENDQTISIGKIRFDKRGYHHSKILRGFKSVLWEDRIYPAEFTNAYAVLYEYNDNVKKPFEFVSMEEPNAGIIPELVKTCFYENKARNQQ
jgi:hypothetical protein